MSRTFIIGDIHGCYDELVELIGKLDLSTDEPVVAVGDLTVRGPDNRSVLDLFSSDPRFSSVMGNHDLALVQYWRGQRASLSPEQEKTLAELQTADERYLRYLASLPLLIDLNSHVVVHAGIRPGVPLTEQSVEDLVLLRTLGDDRTSCDGTRWYEVYEGPPTAVFGHWPGPKPRLGPHAIGLDTGCVYGGQLTAYCIETQHFTSVQAARTYDSSGANFLNPQH
jgi:serine/threonine protein phosphatase 1